MPPQITHALSLLTPWRRREAAASVEPRSSIDSHVGCGRSLGGFVRHSMSREALRARRLSVASRLASFTGPGPGPWQQDGALMGERVNIGRFGDELSDALEE